MKYSEAIDYLYQLRLHGMKLGLETMQALLSKIGAPHLQLRFIHIAGTNGKGSVAAMLASILQTAGYRTGLYTSPHLISFCERIQLNGVMITEAEVAQLVEAIRRHVDDVARRPSLRCPTFFEVTTAIAAEYFAAKRAEIVCWETGLGGRLDATNTVTPIVSVITNIGLDHMEHLGPTVADIAREKAGIIKPAVPVVTNVTDPKAFAQIHAAAKKLQSPLIRADKTVAVEIVSESLDGQTLRVATPQQDYGELQLPLVGAHQTSNCTTVIATLETLRDSGIFIEKETVRQGLARTRWPGRFQIVTGTPRIILDGAHNHSAVVALCATLRKHCAQQPLTLVLGVLKDKDYPAICRSIAPLARQIFTVPVKSERTSAPERLAELCRAANPQASVQAMPSALSALDAARRTMDTTVVVTGSLFLVGEVMQLLELEPRFRETTRKEMAMQ